MKKILMVAAILAFGFTNANAQYDSRYDNRDNRNYDNRDNRHDDNYNSPQYHKGGDSEINYLQREARQKIDAGIRRRALSPREADVLMHEYQRIQGMERRFSSHGRLSRRETKILRNELERLMVDTQRLSSRRGDNWARGRNRF